MIINDKTIFEYLKPNDNEMLSMVNRDDLLYILNDLNRYYIEYRKSLGIDKTNTFGVEIEFENYTGWYGIGYSSFKGSIDSLVGNNKWNIVNDWSLRNGGEVVSEILTDDMLSWTKIKKVCKFISSLGEINACAGAHVHVGSQILGENPVYWYRFLKLWSIYENVIYRFCYGERMGPRPNIIKYARPAACFYMCKLEEMKKKKNYNVLDMLWYMETCALDDRYTKNFGLSYWMMLFDNDYNIYKSFDDTIKGCTVELRVPNGTLNEVIWQNDINFIIKMMLCCKSDRYNEDIIDKRKILVEDDFAKLSRYSKIYLDQVLEFVDIIFDNNLDKINFLKQYLKDINDLDGNFSKVKRLTTVGKQKYK